MTKKEVSINTSWDEFEIGTCRVFVEVLNQYIPVLFFQEHRPKPSISVTMMKALNDILDMPKTEFDRLGDILGAEVYEKSKIKEIHIDQDNDVFENVYSEVIMDTGANIIVKDGGFLCLNDGTYFESLEIGEKSTEMKKPSKEERQQVIDMMLDS